MDRRLKKWELALMFGILCAIALGSWLSTEQQDLADQVIRMHVVANSDSSRDQRLKLAVRDRVLERAEQLYTGSATRAQALEILSRHLGDLTRAGQEEADRWGCGYPVTASLEQHWFPTKEYGNFALPAGTYTALRVVIGKGEGQNWWCVAFPPLCLGAASETVEEAVEAGSFTAGQASLMKREGPQYVLKFRALELLDLLRGPRA